MGGNDKKERVCCFTGHRPEAFPWKEYNKDPRFQVLLKRMEAAVDTALGLGAVKFICGNALGVDTRAAGIVLKKKKDNPAIHLEIAAQFFGHNIDSAACAKIQQEADIVHVVSSEKRRTAAFFQRNKYMVDNSDILIAVYDDQKSKRGGTLRTLEMAKQKGIEIIQVSWGDIV